MKPISYPSIITSSLLLAAATAGAQTWDGNGTPSAGGNWSTGANWNPDTVPGAGHTAILDSTGANRTIIYDSAASGSLGTLTFNQSSAFANILDIQRSLTVTNAITLGASSGGTARLSFNTGNTPATTPVTLTASGGITLNSGGELQMSAFLTDGTSTSARGPVNFGNVAANVTISGGTLQVRATDNNSAAFPATSASNTLTGNLTMTSGSLVIDNATGVADRRLAVSGTVNISGGAISSSRVGAGGFLTFNSGNAIVFNPTSFDTDLNMSIDSTGAQSLATNKTLGNMQFRGTGVKTLTSSASGTGIGQIQMFDNQGATAGSQTTLKLGSNLTSNVNASMPAAQSFGNTLETGRIDLGIDTNGFTLDLTAGATSGAWTPNVSTQSGVTNTVWNLSGSGVIKANRFTFTTSGVTTNVAANTVLTAAGGDSTVTNLGGTGSIDATSTFRYSGTAALATPATLTSNRTIGKLDVTSGTLKLSGTLNAAGTTTVTGGTLLVPLTASLYGGTPGSWTAANLNVLSGGTLAFNIGGAGEFGTTDVTTLLTNLASSSGSGLRAGATLGFDTTTAAGGTFTVADTLANTTGTTGGTLGIHKLGSNTLVIGTANTFTGKTTVSSGKLSIAAEASLGGNPSSATADQLTLNGGTLLTTASFAIDDANRGITLGASGGTIEVDSVTTLTVAATNTISGGALTKTGSGQLTLAGSHSHTGLTTVTAGVLRVSNSGALGGTAAGTVVNASVNSTLGTTLDLNGVSIGSGESLTMASGSLAGDSRASLRTVGTTTNTWAGGVLLTGSKTVQLHANTGGQLEISGPITHSSFTGPVTLRGGGTGTLSGGVSLSNSTNISLNDLNSVWNINTSGNTWGNTNVFRGMLVLGANDALPTTTSLNLGGTDGSGTLKLNGRSQTVAGLTTNVTTTTNKVVNGSATAGTLTVNNSTANTFAGVLGGTGTDENKFSLNKNGGGTLTLSGTNTYTGATNVSTGTLVLLSSGSIANSATVNVLSGASLNVSGQSGGWTVGGTDAQKLSGSGSITGATTIGGSGTHNAGDAGVNSGVGNQAFSSTLNYANQSIFEWDLNANDTTTGFDTVTASSVSVGTTGTIFKVILGATAAAGIADSGNLFWNTPSVTRTWSMSSIFGANFSGAFAEVQPSTSVSAQGSFTITDSALTWTAVPEPTSALVGLLITVGLLGRRRTI